MNTNTVSVSIVVPVYNGQNYLSDCLESIAAQSFHDFEVWVINDGSTDSSQEIAEAFVKRDFRFHLLSQENKGLSGARNAGIAMCAGEYIAFVDSDDRIREDLSVQAVFRRQRTAGGYCML